MILYELKCPSEHFFEGWFRNSDGFDEQSQAGEIACPVCGDRRIAKAPMAPRLARSAEPRATAPAAAPSAGEQLQMLRNLRRAIEHGCEDVGERFAEEARKIHYGEADARGIYGETSAEQAEELADEGVEFSRIPWVPLADG
jgi:hypothetical protein